MTASLKSAPTTSAESEALASKETAREESRFNEQQILGVLEEHEVGTSTKDVCRHHGISETTFYKWKAKFGGMQVSDVAKMRTLESRSYAGLPSISQARLRNASSFLRPIRGETLCRNHLGRIDEDDGFEGRRFRAKIESSSSAFGKRISSYLTWTSKCNDPKRMRMSASSLVVIQ